MDALTRLSIKRPLTMLMLIVTMVIMGYQGYTYLKLERFPNTDMPMVSISVTYAGASPEDIEEQVVSPIEDAVAGVSGLSEMSATATEGSGTVMLEFVQGTDNNQAAIEVERRVSAVKLPDDAGKPTVFKADTGSMPIMVITLNGPQGQDALYTLANDELKARLQAVPGVASVSVTGGRDSEIQIEADPAKLAAYSLSLGEVQQAVANNNVTAPAGSMDQGRLKKSIRAVGQFTSLGEIENVVIKSDQTNGGQVYLQDVATVQEGYSDRSAIFRYNGLDTVSINVTKTNDANTVEVADNVRQVLETFKKELPSGAELAITSDSSTFVRESVAAVLEDLGLAILITSLVMLIFLHTIRSTFIVLLAIPTSLITTFLVMWRLGLSLNQMTLMAMTLVIGILVDDSIVVLENIERHLKMKKPSRQAALDGRAEIGFAALVITLVDVVVYLPVAFVSGMMGQLFYPYAITIVSTTLLSLFVAFTLTPMLAAYWLKDESEPEKPPRGLVKVFAILLKPIAWLWNGFMGLWEAGFGFLSRAYAATLRLCLRNAFTQILVVLIALGALAGGIYMVIGGMVRTEFMPQEDDGSISISITMPAGTNLEASDRAARQAEQIVLSLVPEVTNIRTQVGSSGGGAFGGGSANSVSISLKLVDKADRDRTTTDIAAALRPALEQIPEAQTSVSLSSSMGGGGGAMKPIQVRLLGPDQNVLVDLADQVAAVIKTVPGTADVENTGAARSPETQFVVDRQRAVDLGLSMSQVATTLRTAVSGSTIGTFNPPGGGDEVDIILRMPESTRQDQNQLLQVPLAYKQGQQITLGQVVQTRDDRTAAQITRYNRQVYLTVGSNVQPGYGSADVTDDIEAAIKEQVTFPDGYSFEFSGMAGMQRSSFNELFSAMGLSVLMIYILLVALYQSWLQPLAIMLALPVTVVGAFGGLWLTNNALSLFSLLGMILLMGIVTKNAILIVDFTNQLRERGQPTKKALVEAGRVRLRPVLMTTGALVFALLPVLLGTGAGAESRAPIAAAVVGGNITSTLLSLILVPVVYNFFDWGGGLMKWIVGFILGTGSDTPAIAPPLPAPQPGAAVSLGPPAGQPGAESA
jgi:HAE1 family hydrophobic/amphiphilic exporter-1